MADVRLLRKTAHGRTQLFLPTQNTIIREVKCMGGVGRHKNACLYHVLPELAERTDVSCWHCGEQVGASSVPIPRVYDSVDRVYHVYGTTCSLSCAKAYILEHTSFDRGNHLNVLVRMAREAYGVTEPIVATPPRPALRRFGGNFEPRQGTCCLLVEPPFVSYGMLVSETRSEGTAEPAAFPVAEEPETLQEPPPPGLFDDFAATHTPAPRPPPKRRTPVTSELPPSTTGPLAKFMRT